MVSHQSFSHLIPDQWISPIWGPFAIMDLDDQFWFYVEVQIYIIPPMILVVVNVNTFLNSNIYCRVFVHAMRD